MYSVQMTVYADSTSVSNPVVPDCLVKAFKTKLSSPKRSSLLLKSIACSFEYFYQAVMAAAVWQCDAVEQTEAQKALHHIHLPLPLHITL